MIVDVVRTLYGYNAWANGRILETASHLTATQLLAAKGASFDSVRDTLVHTMSAQWIWLSRWQGTSPTAMFNPDDYADLGLIRARWEAIEANTRRFVDELTAGRLSREVVYATTSGQRRTRPLWQLMLHQVNHGTQHRSEIAMILTEFGHSPGWLDLVYYVAEINAGK